MDREEALEKYKISELVSIVENIEEKVTTYFNTERPCDPFSKIITRLFGKTMVTYKEIVTLCTEGFSDGALSLSRNIYEQLVILNFFSLKQREDDFQQYIENYNKSYEVMRLKSLKFYAEFCQQDFDKKQEYENRLEKLKEETHNNLKSDYWWARVNSFKKLCDLVFDSYNDEDIKVKQFLYHLHLMYKRACLSLHASSMGNSVRLGIDSTEIININPDYSGQAVPLEFVTHCLYFILISICDHYKIDAMDKCKELEALSDYYHKQWDGE